MILHYTELIVAKCKLLELSRAQSSQVAISRSLFVDTNITYLRIKIGQTPIHYTFLIFLPGSPEFSLTS